MNNSQLLNTGIQLTGIVLWGLILKYIIDLDSLGCKCADNWQRKFIEYYIIFSIVISILHIVNFNMYIPPAVLTLYFITAVVFVAIVYQYIQGLKTANCQCSNDVMRDILEITNYLQIGLIVLIIVIAIYIVMSLGSFIENNGNLDTGNLL